jgi:DNA-binding GntR family transcriptional regulator
MDTVTLKLERTISGLRFEIKSKEASSALAVARRFHETIYRASSNEMLSPAGAERSQRRLTISARVVKEVTCARFTWLRAWAR